MYKLPYFTETSEEKVISFMKENSFAVVTGMGSDYPVATQLPLHVELRDGNIFLTGHLMKNTDHHRAFLENDQVLVVFTGPHCYISASWYKNPAVASTWNYISVQAKGKIRFTDESGTFNAIKDITERYEGTGSPAAFHQLQENYVASLLKAIAGFEIEVKETGNVFKLSQNHDREDRLSIIAQLQTSCDANAIAIAKAMKERL